jgi:hypothetical protein
MKLLKFLPLLVILFRSSFGFNHPEISWKSVSTGHFIINYYDATEPAVYATWKIAEESYNTLSKLFNYDEKEKIRISLADYDDYSNGWADWTAGNIMIWLPDSRFDLRGNTVWLRNVITHELTHIISLEKRRSYQMLDIGVSLNITTPDEQYGISEPFAAMALMPSWFAEGIAQYESEKNGFDCWDSRRDMVLRCAVLDKKELSLPEMEYFNHNSAGNEMVYNQGMSFIKFIENKIGENGLISIFKSCAEENLPFENQFIRRVGASPDLLYREWIDSLRTKFKSVVPSKNTEYQEMYTNGDLNENPGISPDGKYWGCLTNDKDDGTRTDLVIFKHGESVPFVRIPYAQISWCFDKSSSRVYYLKSREMNSHGSEYNNVYCYDLKYGREKRLTKDARVYDISLSPSGNSLACVKYDKGIFSVVQLNPASGQFTNMIDGKLGDPFMKLCFNPQDSTQIAITRIIDGKSKLLMYSRKNGTFDTLTKWIAQEENPFWAGDGRIYFNADYDGIFNIYSVLPDGTGLTRHTYVTGGVFSPFTCSNGTMLCALYGSGGFKIVRVSPFNDTVNDTGDYGCKFETLPVPKGKVTIKARPYVPQYLRPIHEIQFSADLIKNKSLFTGQYQSVLDSTEMMFSGIYLVSQSDALQKKSKMLGLGVNVQGESIKNRNYSFRNNEPANLLTMNRGLDLFRNSISADPLDRKRVLERNLTENVKRYSMMQQESTADSSSIDQASIVPYLSAIADFENRETSATSVLQLQTYVPLIFPLAFFVNGSLNLQWQLGRDLYAGIVPQFKWFPIHPDFPFTGAIPLYLNWGRFGYYNKYFDYNLADASQCLLMLGPQFVPQEKIAGQNDTVFFCPSGLTAGLELFHSIPILRYSSLQIFTSNTVVYNNRKTLDETYLLQGVSRTFISSQTGLKATFPIVTEINQKALYYWDALFGHIGYSFSMRAKGEFFDSLKYQTGELFTDPNYNHNLLKAAHVISAGFELGNYKSYTFFRKLSIEINYELLRRSVSLNATLF